MKSYPVVFEIFDEINEPLATVTAQDSECADVKITGTVCRESWPELSALIQDSLDKMFPDDSE